MRAIGRRAALPAPLLAAAALASGCATAHPPRLSAGSLAEAQTFPYFLLYWTGPSFAGRPLTAVDGRQSYDSAIGESVYYGDCTSTVGLGGGGSCGLPLKVTTVIYRLHSNAALGSQRDVLMRGVPATIYDKGRSIELYSGRLAIDVFSDTPAHAQLAVGLLRPLNASSTVRDTPAPPAAPGAHHMPSAQHTPGAPAALPPPVYCPGLTGRIGAALRSALLHLPGRPCQRARAALQARGRPSEAPLSGLR